MHAGHSEWEKDPTFAQRDGILHLTPIFCVSSSVMFSL